MLVRGIDRPVYDVVGLSRADSWDHWVETRARRYRSVRTASYVHPDICGAADLDAYGSWENAPEYGFVWYPRGMPVGWEPYRAGRWIWRDPWGWTWLSAEPWGWAPYHYGRWAVVRGRWGWVPVGPRAAYPGYSPAVVGFVGGGPGWSVSVSMSGGGFVGWFPLAPREPFHPWWYHARSTANVTGYNYAYRNHVTVVTRDVFVRGGRVDRDVVRDTRIVHDVSAAPILRGPIPVLPTRESIRVAPVGVQGRGEVRPPKRIADREVVTRVAPPPAPPTFDRKLAVIRESGGQPVTSDVARRLSAEEHRGEKAAQPVRPAGSDQVVLAPRGEVKESRRPQALPPSAARAPANAERPVTGREEAPPARAPAPTAGAEKAPAPEPRHEAEPVRPMPEPRRVEVPNAPPAREPVPPPQPEVKREPAPTRPAPEGKPERHQQPNRPPERVDNPPVPVPTARAARPPLPEQRPETEPPRPVVVPRHVDVPNTPPSRERAPAPQPEQLRREPVPVQPVPPPQAGPERHEPKKPEPDQVDQKKKAKPGQAVPNATPTPKKGKNYRPDKEDEPGKKND